MPFVLRILVTDGEQRASLAVVRSLGLMGHDVWVCSAREKPLAGSSRYAKRSILVPDPKSSPEAYAEAVSRTVEEDGVEVLLPITDISAPLLLPLREVLPGLIVPFPERAAYEAASDKNRLAEIAGELGVPVPPQLVLQAPESVPDALASGRLDTLGWPLVVKPARSAVVSDAGVTTLPVTFAGGLDDLARTLETLPAGAFPVMLQKKIEGPGAGAFLLCDRGTVLASFAHRRLREHPPTGGVSVYRETAPVPDVLVAHASRLLSHFGWTGVAMVEFKIDADTGTAYLMEINGRFWGSLQLAIDAGVDFPRLLIELFTEPVVSSVAPPRHVRSRWLWGEVDHLLWIMRAPSGIRRAHPGLPTRLQALGRFLVPWRPRDRLEVFRVSDPMPFLRESLQWFSALGR